MKPDKKLSKTISFALRHAPADFGLSLDPEGWVEVNDLIRGLQKFDRSFSGVSEKQIIGINEKAEKQRWEIKDGRIRALYGHSLDKKIEKPAQEPPELLLHGTTQDALKTIRANGLSPMSRQFVHLSTEANTASMVGSRRTAQPILLTIRARDAWNAGIQFFHGNQDTWLSEPIPPEFIEFP